MINILKKIKNRKIISTLLICTFLLHSVSRNYCSAVEEPTKKSDVIINKQLITQKEDFYAEKNFEYTKKKLFAILNPVEQQAITDNLKYVGSTLSNAAYNNVKALMEQYLFEDTDLVLNYLFYDKYQKVFARYKVNDDKTYTNVPIYGLTLQDEYVPEEDRIKLTEYMDRLLRFYPIEIFQKIKYVILQSDGKDDVLATVSVIDNPDEATKSYILKLDVKDLHDSRKFRRNLKDIYLYIMMHEDGQIIPDEELENANPKNIFTYDGVNYYDTSYLALFYKNFWINEEKRRENFYIRHSDEQYEYNTNDFVSKKASKGLMQDFLESYDYFLDKLKPGANYLKDRKALFFYNFEWFRYIRRTAGRNN